MVLSGLQGRELLLANLAAWQMDTVPMVLPSTSADTDAFPNACRITCDLDVTPRREGGDVPVGLDDTAVLHLSSGSTDRPKIARRSAASVILDAEGYRAGLALVPDDRVAVPVPLTHSFGWGVAFAALLSGCDIDPVPLIRAGTVARKADQGAVSVLALTAPLARLLVRTPRQGEAVLRAAMAGAGSVSDELNAAFQTRFGLPLLRGYGCSETGGTLFGESGLGRPVHGVEILSPPPGHQGELVLRLAAPIEGYLGGLGEPVHEWRTGDLVQHNGDGDLQFVERIRGPLRLNGRFIRADIAEQALRSVPGVTDVFLFVLPRSTTPETEDLYAVVEGNAKRDALLAALADHRSQVPSPRLMMVDTLPRTAVGKPDRRAMEAAVQQEASLRAECDALVSHRLVQTLTALGLDAPDPQDFTGDSELRTRDLALFGLSSLDWIALATAIEQEIGAEIPDGTLVTPEQRCVAGWGEAVFAARATAAGPQRP